ncbi:hypothetical protein BKA81DRAFT_117106 [Phyllosticta paracitricarpa]
MQLIRDVSRQCLRNGNAKCRSKIVDMLEHSLLSTAWQFALLFLFTANDACAFYKRFPLPTFWLNAPTPSLIKPCDSQSHSSPALLARHLKWRSMEAAARHQLEAIDPKHCKVMYLCLECCEVDHVGCGLPLTTATAASSPHFQSVMAYDNLQG